MIMTHFPCERKKKKVIFLERENFEFLLKGWECVKYLGPGHAHLQNIRTPLC